MFVQKVIKACGKDIVFIAVFKKAGMYFSILVKQGLVFSHRAFKDYRKAVTYHSQRIDHFRRQTYVLTKLDGKILDTEIKRFIRMVV